VKRKVAARAAWPAARDELPRGTDRKEYRFRHRQRAEGGPAGLVAARSTLTGEHLAAYAGT